MVFIRDLSSSINEESGRLICTVRKLFSWSGDGVRSR